MREGQTLREAVEAQAAALVQGDLAAFASYAAPQALPLMYRTPSPTRVRAYNILDIDTVDDHGRSEVQFRGRWSYLMRGAWQRTDRGWKAVALDIPPESMRTSLWRRLLLKSDTREPVPPREDLS